MFIANMLKPIFNISMQEHAKNNKKNKNTNVAAEEEKEFSKNAEGPGKCN